jgi:hypothetical protein
MKIIGVFEYKTINLFCPVLAIRGAIFLPNPLILLATTFSTERHGCMALALVLKQKYILTALLIRFYRLGSCKN